MGVDPTAPIANLSYFVQVLPPVPELGHRQELRHRVGRYSNGQRHELSHELRLGNFVSQFAEDQRVDGSWGEEVEESDVLGLTGRGGLFSYSHLDAGESVDLPRLRAEQDIPEAIMEGKESKGKLTSGAETCSLVDGRHKAGGVVLDRGGRDAPC